MAKKADTPVEYRDYPLDNCTPSQVEVMEYMKARKPGERAFIFWLGGVRSGKSYGAAIALVSHVVTNKAKTYMVLAYTQTQAVQIYGNYLKTVAETMGYRVRLTRGAASPRLSFLDLGSDILFKGADKAGKDAAIQGLTLDGLVVDEVPLLNRDALHQAEARVSGKGAIRVYTSNKTSEFHWTTKYYIHRLRMKEIPGLLIDSTVEENPHVDDEYVKERTGEFTGVTLTRFIENKFALDAPPLYKPVLGELKVRGNKVTTVFGHAGGYEVIKGRWGKNGPDDVLVVQEANSFLTYDDLDPSHIGSRDRTVMVNSNQSLLARWLRAAGYSIRGYKEMYSDRKRDILKHACAGKQIWCSVDIRHMHEALMTYSKPGVYDMPIIIAFEALAEPVRSKLKIPQGYVNVP